jgi:oligopeptide transport system ATP-binding protein
MQMIFQDPFSSLNPRSTVRRILEEPLIVHAIGDRATRKNLISEMMERVGLRHDAADRYPHEFSGGQRQRIGIARALMLKPDLIICDEPVSALDVSIRAQILNLLTDLQSQLGLAYLFISHDLSVIRHLADTVAVMYLGQLVETGSREAFWAQPLHPYSQALLAARPATNPHHRLRDKVILEGEMASPFAISKGCDFRNRCRFAFDRCSEIAPALREARPGHDAMCHLVGSERARLAHMRLPQSTCGHRGQAEVSRPEKSINHGPTPPGFQEPYHLRLRVRLGPPAA